MWFSKKETAPGLTEELVQRVWDIQGHLKQLDTTLDERLTELAARYRRAEQSEKRLDDKKASTPCEDEEKARRGHPGLRARKERSQRLNSRIKEQV